MAVDYIQAYSGHIDQFARVLVERGEAGPDQIAAAKAALDAAPAAPRSHPRYAGVA